MTRCPSISAVVLTYNEAPNIRHCLESVRDLCEIFVVDSGSDDATVEICRGYTDRIHVHPYANHASQWQWALANLPLATEWVLALDADFTVTPELAARIASDIAAMPPNVAGIYVRHLYVFGGGVIRFGGTKQYWLRLIRRGRAQPDASDLVDFRFVVDGDVARWREAVVEYNRHDDDISVWLRKQDKFALRLAVEEEMRRAGSHHWQLQPRAFGGTDERFAWLRDRWLSMPLFLRPALYFVYRYVLAGGFLDGRGGFLYHALQGFWLRLLVDWKIDQIRRLKLTPSDLETLGRVMLETRSGSVDELVAKARL
jgi:glycosyltransferase involved in cell wall biosynthesis